MSQPDPAARLWGALNRLRAIALSEYGGGSPDGGDAAGDRTVGRVLLALGLAPAGVPILRRLASQLVPAAWDEVFLVLAPLALFFLGLPGVVFLVRARRRSGDERSFLARSAARDRQRSTFARLAERFGGSVEPGVEAGARFLEAHWHDRAPTVLLHDPAPQRSDARISARFALEGAPTLVQTLDFASDESELGGRPPTLALLVASPIEPSAAEAEPNVAPYRQAAPFPDDLDEVKALVALGFRVEWCRAGASAVHDGPADALLDEEHLERAARLLASAVRAAPTGTRPEAPAAPAVVDASKLRAVVEGFLVALRDRDLVGVLAHAHPRLFVDQAREPDLQSLAARIDARRAWPTAWEEHVYVHASSGGSRTLDTLDQVDESEVTCVNLAMTALHDDGRAGIHLCVLRLRGRWGVTGYLWDGKPVLGLEFPSSGD